MRLLADLTPWVCDCGEAALFDVGPHLALPCRLPRRYIGIAERRSLVERFLATCTYCGRQGAAARGPDGEEWQTDHYVPKARGGSCDPTNIVLVIRR